MNLDCNATADGIALAHTDLLDQHGLSAFGLTLQLMRLNLLVPSDVYSLFGLRMRYSEDWSYRMATSRAVQQALLMRIPLPSSITSRWDVRSWQPFEGRLFIDSPWQLRGCPACFRYGYHTNLFQMPWIEKCPWHRLRLVTTCQGCGKSLGTSIERDTPLLLCPCGHDGIDHNCLLEQVHPFSPARNHFVRRYLQWVDAARRVCVAFGNDDDGPAHLATLGRLVRLPAQLAQRVQADNLTLSGAHEQWITVVPDDASAPRSGDEFQSCCQSFWTRDPTMVEVPLGAGAALADVTRSWGSRCPKGSLSQVEGRRFGVPQVGDSSQQHSRMALVLFPPYSVHSRSYFDGRVLARDVYGVLSALCGSHLSRHAGSEAGGLSELLISRTLSAVLARG